MTNLIHRQNHKQRPQVKTIALILLMDTFGIVYQKLWDVDFRKQATRLEVPVYFLIGRHDVKAPTKLTEEYFNLLTAPHKELIWFERSGRNPWMNETEKFVDVMVNKILSPQ